MAGKRCALPHLVAALCAEDRRLSGFGGMVLRTEDSAMCAPGGVDAVVVNGAGRRSMSLPSIADGPPSAGE